MKHHDRRDYHRVLVTHRNILTPSYLNPNLPLNASL